MMNLDLWNKLIEARDNWAKHQTELWTNELGMKVARGDLSMADAFAELKVKVDMLRTGPDTTPPADSARGVVSEGLTASEIAREQERMAQDASDMQCACPRCMQKRREAGEKGRVGVGPHTSARASGGCACQRNHCPGCDWGTSATHHATQPTQVLGNKGPDTTLHG